MNAVHVPVKPRRFPRLHQVASQIADGLLLAAVVVAVSPPAKAADDATLERLATCQDSWLDWKEPDPRMTAYQRYVHTQLRSDDGGQSFDPLAPTRLLGLPLLQVFPQSVGMGVGFSATVDIDATKARNILETRLGRSMTCERGDGVLSCELKLADRKTVMLMANLGAEKPTLLGCYYFYQN
jgi:hypothetical protein